MTDMTKNFLLFLSALLPLIGCTKIRPITNTPNATPISIESTLQGPADENGDAEPV